MVYTQRPYSRLAKVEESKNKRTAIIFVVLSAGLLIFLGIFGFTLLSKAAVFIGDFNSVDKPVDNSDTIAPPPPIISTIPENTNQQNITIKGSTEADATVNLHINQTVKELTADTNGSFTTTVELDKGDNTIFATSADRAGNESSDSKKFNINFDTEKPEVEVTKPKDGDKFYGKSQQQLTVEGKTESTASVTINGRVVILDSNGNFKFQTSLGAGENSFNVKSTDRAGNLNELTIVVTYTP